ncbi:MAG: hypothetical protein ACRC2T_01745 [Thermoguttaceae bacterium]
MKKNENGCGCSCCNVTRRQFVAAGAVGATAVAASTGFSFGQQADGKKFTVRVVFSLHAEVQPGPDWPNVGHDFRPVMKEYMDAFKKACPNIEFVSSMANGPEAAKTILTEDGDKVKGYIVIQMNCWNQVVQTIAASGKPTLYCDYLYAGSGGFLVYTAGFLRSETENFAFMSSSKMSDIVEAVKCFDLVLKGGSAKEFSEAVEKVRVKSTKAFDKNMKLKEDDLKCLSTKELLDALKKVKIITVGGPWMDYVGAAKETFGIEVINLDFTELNETWNKFMEEKTEAQKVADMWKREAKVVEDVSDETLLKSAAMYLAEKAVCEKHGAMGITVNCLGGFYGKHIFAYPCLGFHQLLNEGMIGGCECDIRSALTMAVFTTLTKGRPGYISDPVMDSATRQIIYAHCVCANKMFGPDGESNPYEILTHSEDRQGASLRSIVPTGYMTTTVELKPETKQILFHQAVAVDNSFEDKACRTKICGEVPGDFEKLFTEWDQWGWHRVTYFGDLKKEVNDLANAIGWTVLEEA